MWSGLRAMAGAPTAAPSAARPADDAGAAAWARLEFGDGKTLAVRFLPLSLSLSTHTFFLCLPERQSSRPLPRPRPPLFSSSRVRRAGSAKCPPGKGLAPMPPSAPRAPALPLPPCPAPPAPGRPPDARRFRLRRRLQARGVAFSIGRHDSNDLVSDSAHLSGRHCTLAPLARPEAGDAALVLTDSSTNGTFVDGSKVHKDSVPLRWGQRVELVKGHKVTRCMHLRVSSVPKGVPCSHRACLVWDGWCCDAAWPAELVLCRSRMPRGSRQSCPQQDARRRPQRRDAVGQRRCCCCTRQRGRRW